MTKNKALGKPPPYITYSAKEMRVADGANKMHYRQALIEAAEVLEAGFDTKTPRRNLAKMLRISAGVKKEVED